MCSRAPAAAASRRSRSTIETSASAACPRSPSRVETTPSCITPPSARPGSSQCSAIGRPRSEAYSNARRASVPPNDRVAVVAEGDDPGVAQLRQLRQLRPRAAARHRADAQHPRRTAARRLLHLRDHRRPVHRGLRVRHRADRREAAARSRRHARRHRLLVLLARLAQVRVQVDEARRDDPPRRLQHGRPRAVDVRPQRRDPAVADQHVERRIDAAARVDHASAADQQVAAHVATPTPCVSR